MWRFFVSLVVFSFAPLIGKYYSPIYLGPHANTMWSSVWGMTLLWGIALTIAVIKMRSRGTQILFSRIVVIGTLAGLASALLVGNAAVLFPPVAVVFVGISFLYSAAFALVSITGNKALKPN